MIVDRTGQVWRKLNGCKGKTYDAVVIRSTDVTGLNDKGLQKGTQHWLVRWLHAEKRVEIIDWYEPDFDLWESKPNMLRLV